MDKIEFCKLLEKETNEIGQKLNTEQQEKLYKYMNLLLEWNQKINLTAITKADEVITKHFIDSLTSQKHIKENATVADIGTGAGFPGIPLAISKKDIKVTLVDSLNKRINFLKEVKQQLDLKNIEAIHSRAEDFGKNKEYREVYDVAISRAVARLNTLVEYLLPTVKVRGCCICMKGPDIQEEIEEARTAIQVLGGTIKEIEEFTLPNTDIKRTIIIIEKIKNTPAKYPRKSGLPAKEPIK